MNAYTLMRQLKSCLTPALATLPLPVRGRDRNGQPMESEGGPKMRPAAVYLGSMPSTGSVGMSAVRIVVIQPMHGFDDDEQAYNVRLALRLCIVSEDLEEAENDLMNLISAVRLALLELPGGVLPDGQYRITEEAGNGGKAPWERPDEQFYPFLQAHIFTTWQTQGVQYGPTV